MNDAQEDFSRFVEQHHRVLTDFSWLAVRSNGLPRESAKDVRQEGLIVTFQAWPSRLILAAEGEQLAFARASMMNKAANMRRLHAHSRTDCVEVDDLTWIAGSDSTNLAERCLAREVLGAVTKALGELSDVRRKIVVLSMVDTGQHEIGQAVGLGQSAVSRHLKNARKQLKSAVGEETLRELGLGDGVA